MIVAKTLDGPHYVSDGYLTGAKHMPTQATIDEAFVHGSALNASEGLPLTLIKKGEWAAVRARVTKKEAFAILGEPVDKEG